ncbi:hypothetical protein SDC9_13976 [bioreactor metagenome]|uniref:Phospholipase C/D domain-containing protein n=1 Tax=bioreactor metagenome TaxID=1076179 RepID=A0A644TMR4_9ZZZZ|nr:zinc dependent phospholipase C family protein [Negativicutes bacterium]
MFTFHHGLWLFFLSRRHAQVWQFVIGSMFPDYVYFVMIIIALFRGQIELSNLISLNPQVLLGIMPLYPWAVKADLLGHSVVVWGVFLVLALLPAFNRLQAFIIGWGSHLLIDGLTHGAYANYYLYPLSMDAVHSPVSYWEAEFFAREFKIVNGTLMVLIIVYLIYERWRKKIS